MSKRDKNPEASGKKHKLTIFAGSVIFSIVLSMLLVILSLVLTAYSIYSLKVEESVSSLKSSTEAFSSDTLLMEDLSVDKVSEQLKWHLSNTIEKLTYVDGINLYSKDGDVIYSTGDKSMIGTDSKYKDGLLDLKSGDFLVKKDQTREGIDAPQIWVYGVIDDDNGKIIGYLMLAMENENLWSQVLSYLYQYFFLGIGVVLFAVAIAVFANQKIRKALKGATPEEYQNNNFIVDRALDTLDEGIIIVDNRERILMYNRQMLRMCEIDGVEKYKNVKDYIPWSRVSEVIETREPVNYEPQLHGGRYYLASRVPVVDGSKVIAAIAVYRDISNLTKLSEELSGANNLVDTLRAYHHDFKNKLHIILGLLEIEKYEEAVKYISGLEGSVNTDFSDVSSKITVAELCALVIGKRINANEKGIKVVVSENTKSDELTEGVPIDAYCTIIGNLLENAIEELLTADKPDKRIDVELITNREYSLITVTDNGRGITQEVLDKMFVFGYSTKSVQANRGIGMPAIKSTAEKYNGGVEVDTEVSQGTSITVYMKKNA